MSRITAASLLKGAMNNRSMHDFLKPSVLSQSNSSPRTPKRKATSPAALHDINENGSSLDEICKGINAIVEKLSSMQVAIDNNNSITSHVAERSSSNEQKIQSISTMTNFLHQSQLNDKMEISGISHTTFNDQQDLKYQVVHFLNEMSIKVESYEVADAYLRKRNVKGTLRTLVVIVFVHGAIKSRIMRKKFAIKTGPATKFYFNDVLTPQNREMMYNARELMRAGKFSKVGTLNGQIYVRLAADGDKIFIDSLAEMEEIARMSVSKSTSSISNCA